MKPGDVMYFVLNSRWMTVVLLVLLTILTALVTADFERTSAARRNAIARAGAAQAQLTVDPKMFEPISIRLNLADGRQPFFTRFFEPAPPPPKVVEPTPAPVVAPTPPPRKVGLVYQGLYEGSNGGKQAFLLVESNQVVLRPGGTAVGGWAIAEMSLRTLTLTNKAGQTNILQFNSPKVIEVPAN
jgi:hypothetical protein